MICVVVSEGGSLVVDPSCGSDSFVLHPISSVLTIDYGIELGWAVGAVWLTVYAITFLARYIASEMSPNDTNP